MSDENIPDFGSKEHVRWLREHQKDNRDMDATVRAMIVIGPGEEDESAEAYADLFGGDPDEMWHDRADWIDMEENG